MDDYEYEDDSGEEFEEDYDSGEEFEEDADFEDEVETEEDEFEDEVEIEEEEDFEEEVEDEEEEDFEETVEDDDESEEEEDFEEIIENDEDSEEEEDFEEVVDEEEDSEETEEQDDLIPWEMPSLRVYEEEEEEVSEFVPLAMTPHRIIYEDEDDYMDEEVHGLIPARMTSSRIVFEDEEEQLDERIPLEITSPSPGFIYEDSVIYDDEREQVDELIPLEITPPIVLPSVTNGSRDLHGSVAINDGLVNDSNESEANLQANNENGNVADACPICLETWTSGGNHQVCCLPCGHVYGMSCIKKWVQSSGKCPQCKSVCTLKDIIVLYATRLCVADKELQKTSATNFPFTKEGFSALQQYAFSLQKRVEAISLRADDLRSRMNSLEQKCREQTASEQQSTEH